MYLLMVLDITGDSDTTPGCISDSIDKLKEWADEQFGDTVVWEEVCTDRFVATLNEKDSQYDGESCYTIDTIDTI